MWLGGHIGYEACAQDRLFDMRGVRMQAEPTTPVAGSSGSQAGRPRTPDGKAGSSNSSSLGQCFGMGRTLEEAEQEERPLGVVGLRNLGGLVHFSLQLGGAIAMSSLLGICLQ